MVIEFFTDEVFHLLSFTMDMSFKTFHLGSKYLNCFQCVFFSDYFLNFVASALSIQLLLVFDDSISNLNVTTFTKDGTKTFNS